MANVVVNAELSKVYKDKASGIATSVSGSSLIGLIDTRNIVYKDESRHICGIKYDKNKKTIYMTDTEQADSKNIGIFVTTYDLEVVIGKAIVREKIENSYELAGVAVKHEMGGYNEYEEYAEVGVRKVALNIIVGTAKDKLVLRNSKGVLFVCDFKTGKWYTMAPGQTQSDLYRMSGRDLNISSLFKFSFPVPSLDRSLYENVGAMESGSINKKKHIIDNV